jgi:hypothetical protein
MTTNIFKKAKTAYNNSYIQRTGTSAKNEYFDIKDAESEKWHMVKIETDANGTTATCDCMSKTFHVDKPTFCSHIIAVIYKKYFDTKLER